MCSRSSLEGRLAEAALLCVCSPAGLRVLLDLYFPAFLGRCLLIMVQCSDARILEDSIDRTHLACDIALVNAFSGLPLYCFLAFEIGSLISTFTIK